MPGFMKSRLLITATALALAGPAAWFGARPAAGVTVASQTAGPTRDDAQVWAQASAAVPRYQHIFVIADVGHDYGAMFGNKYAPVLNQLARQYGLASRYYTTSDPDVANIVTILAGKSYGVNTNFPYWDEQISAPSLLSELTSAHMTWKAYYQGLPYPGYLGTCYPVRCNGTPDADTFFTYKHEGVANFSYVAGNPAQARNMVPATELAADSRSGRLPSFGLIIPDECRDGHGGPPLCEDGTSAYHEPNDNRLVRAGDAYIGDVVREIMSGPQWSQGNNAIVITFTEGDTSAGCCGEKKGTGHVMTVVVTSHGPRGLTDPTPYNHYSLLSTIQHAFGLGCLQHTCEALRVTPMSMLFGGTAVLSGLRNAEWDRSSAAAPAAPATATRRDATRTTPSWVQVTSPDVGPNDNGLGAIAGRSASDIWAVGNYLPNAHPDVTSTLAVHYNGTSWTHVPTPNVGHGQNTLLGVTALPDGTAWAVGDYVLTAGGASRALIEHWNGTGWSVVPSPNPGSRVNILYGVAATSDHSVWAVGAWQGRSGVFRTLIEHWTGSQWVTAPSPDPGSNGNFLYAVTVAGHNVFASGQEFGAGAPDRQMLVADTPHGWELLPLPDARVGGSAASASPFAIAGSEHELWLAGFARTGHTGYHTLVENVSQDGFTQLATPDPTPQDNYLWGIAAIGDGDAAWAVGDDWTQPSGNNDSVIEYGTKNGGWTLVPSPNPGLANGGNTVLGGVVAFGPDNAWAVGTFDGPNARQTLILHYTG
jgi:hypothetical protein